MESGNAFFEVRDVDPSQALNVLIIYENLAAGQRAMRLCRDLAWQQEGDLSLQPRLWRLDVVANPVCGGFAIADAVKADVFIVSTNSQVELSKPVQHWLKLCLAVARKAGTSAAMITLLGADDQINEADFLNLQFLRNMAQEVGLEFFAPFANREEALDKVRAKAKPAATSPGRLDEAGALAAQQVEPAYPPTMLRTYSRDTNYREWGIND